ncbi:MAG TPA: YihY/virulence factor BrkB family protein [Pseudonocardiaceae bacterium]|nr:YihY/virulence factor BrkB family protein [Pseudonocardiaceae bacterium]
MLDTTMSAQPDADAQPAPPVKRGTWPLVKRTLAKAWHGNIFSEAAEAAYWQTLSLPPLLLGLLGSLGFLSDWFGRGLVTSVQERIITFSRTVFSANVVDTIISPTVADILTKAQAEVASIGFLISLWAGSSAMASFVDAITVAYGQYGVRNEVWQRFFALLLYLVALVLAVIGLPVLALGPNFLPKVFPSSWRDNIADVIGAFYYPVVAVLLMIALATLYKLALPRKLPWYRGLPGAALAMAVFLLASVGIRVYLLAIGRTGYTYGALAAPIAFLLFTFFIGLAIVIGAHFNSAIQEMWPAKFTHRRRWRKLETAEAESGKSGAGESDAEPKAGTEAEPKADDEPAGEKRADPPATG